MGSKQAARMALTIAGMLAGSQAKRQEEDVASQKREREAMESDARIAEIKAGTELTRAKVSDIRNAKGVQMMQALLPRVTAGAMAPVMGPAAGAGMAAGTMAPVVQRQAEQMTAEQKLKRAEYDADLLEAIARKAKALKSLGDLRPENQPGKTTMDNLAEQLATYKVMEARKKYETPVEDGTGENRPGSASTSTPTVREQQAQQQKEAQDIGVVGFLQYEQGNFNNEELQAAQNIVDGKANAIDKEIIRRYIMKSGRAVGPEYAAMVEWLQDNPGLMAPASPSLSAPEQEFTFDVTTGEWR